MKMSADHTLLYGKPETQEQLPGIQKAKKQPSKTEIHAGKLHKLYLPPLSELKVIQLPQTKFSHFSIPVSDCA